jgi:type II secretory pathway component PulK
MDNQRHNRKPSASRGQALVPVIFVMLILTALAITFATSAHREIRASANFNTQTQRYFVELGAVNYAMSALAQTSNNGATYGIVPSSADTDANGWMQIGDAWVKIDATDTSGLIDLNTVTQTTLNQIPILQQNPDIVAAMIDWRTTSTTPSTNGAKSEYYNTLTPPYDSNNGPYDSVEQLLLVKEMTPTILYGTPSGSVVDPSTLANQSSISAPGGLGSAGSTASAAGRNQPTRQATTTKPGGMGSAAGTTMPGTTTGTGTGTGTGTTTAAVGDTDWTDIYNASTIPLAEMFTTVAWERNVASDGSPRINVNTAAVADLTGIGLSSNLANAIIRFRTPATTGTGGSPGTTKPGTTTTLTTPVKIKDITRQTTGGTTARPATSSPSGGPTGTTGTTGGTTAGTTAYKTLGDLLSVPGFTQTVMQQVADQLSIDAKAYHADMVNINTAPQEVLAAVPGMDHTTLQAILAYRQNGQAFQSMNDFFSLQGLTRTQFQNVVGKLCTKSSFYRVRVRVRMPGQDTQYGVTALVQMTESGPQILQWKEAQRTPGWAYWLPSPTLPTPTPPTLTNSSTSSSSSGSH